MTGRPRRRGSCRAPRKRIAIICEGSRTEKIYFEGFRKEYRISIFVKPSKDRTPRGMMASAQRMIKELDLDLQGGDEVWCVFDVDNNNEEDILDAVCPKSHIQCAISNPCFEIWFLLHFTLHTSRFGSCGDVIKQLRKYIADYEKSKDVFQMLIPRLETAMTNAKKLRVHHNSQGRTLPSKECNPSTQVDLLVAKLRVIKDEISAG